MGSVTAAVAERFIFTVATGRCGQRSLTDLVEQHVPGCYGAFEEPDIVPFLPRPFDAYERRFRRRFVETHELLGRGKVLGAYERGDHSYIESIVAKRMRWIRRAMKKRKASIYFDISKYFARGLHVGFDRAVDRYALVNLVRDPLQNMRSFLNRAKNFRLDNNLPDAAGNVLRLSSSDMATGELYLWCWCELYLRFDQMRESSKVTCSLEIRTDSLQNAQHMNAALDALGLEHTPVRALPPNNTNTQQGLPETRVSEADVRLFERFLNRVPGRLLDRIVYLKDYDPWARFGFRQVESHASARA